LASLPSSMVGESAGIRTWIVIVSVPAFQASARMSA
jgi:hypothetical protein